MGRTTLAIDDDVLEAARSLARLEGKTIGEIVSELARRGLRPEPGAAKGPGGFPVFRVSEKAPPLTIEIVHDADEE